MQFSGKMSGGRDENLAGHFNPEKLDKEAKEVLRMRNQLINNYKQAYQNIKLRQLQALIQDILTYIQVDLDSDFETQPLDELISYPLENIQAEGSSVIWFVKTIESTILNTFMVETIDEYRGLFQSIDGFYPRDNAPVFQVQP